MVRKALLVSTVFGASLLFSFASHAADPAGRAAAAAAKARHAERLFEIEGVVGVGSGERSGVAAVLVLVEGRGVRGLPAQLDGTPVRVIVTGKIHAIHHRQNHRGGPGDGDTPDDGGGNVDPKDRFDQPMPIGVSVGSEASCSAGTIGARLTDGRTSAVYGLSNNHVWAEENQADIGDNGSADTGSDEILQPGRYDSACSHIPADAIGHLVDYEPIIFSNNAANTVDAAVALIDGLRDLDCATPAGGYGAPASGTGVPAVVGMDVRKYGRTTELTSGTIVSTDIDVSVGYSSGTARFVDQIMVQGGKGGFLNSGDSGSLLVVDNPTNDPVGLLYASGRGGRLAFANHIGDVLFEFGLMIDDCGS